MKLEDFPDDNRTGKCGREPKYAAWQIKAVRQWESPAELCERIGITRRAFKHMRTYRYRKTAP